MPDAEQADRLKAMTQPFNADADRIAGELLAPEVSNKIEAQWLLCHEIRQRFGLSAQTAILRIHRLGAFIGYKAKLAGVAVVFVDPRATSRTCAECGHCEKANRKSRGEFSCRACGHRADADANAARNIRAQARSKRASGLGNQPGDRVA